MTTMSVGFNASNIFFGSFDGAASRPGSVGGGSIFFKSSSADSQLVTLQTMALTGSTGYRVTAVN